jgi:hypothetical protein
MAYNDDKERAKRILCDVYGYTDIHELCPPEIDQNKVKRFFDTVFSYHETPIEYRKSKE